MGSGAFPLCATRVPLGGMCVLVYTTRFLLNSPMTRLAWSDCAGKSKSLCRRQGGGGDATGNNRRSDRSAAREQSMSRGHLG